MARDLGVRWTQHCSSCSGLMSTTKELAAQTVASVVVARRVRVVEPNSTLGEVGKALIALPRHDEPGYTLLRGSRTEPNVVHYHRIVKGHLMEKVQHSSFPDQFHSSERDIDLSRALERISTNIERIDVPSSWSQAASLEAQDAVAGERFSFASHVL